MAQDLVIYEKNGIKYRNKQKIRQGMDENFQTKA